MYIFSLGLKNEMRFLKLSSGEQTIDIVGSQGMGEESPGRADNPQVAVNQSPPKLPGSHRYQVASDHQIDRWHPAGGRRARNALQLVGTDPDALALPPLASSPSQGALSIAFHPQIRFCFDSLLQTFLTSTSGPEN